MTEREEALRLIDRASVLLKELTQDGVHDATGALQWAIDALPVRERLARAQPAQEPVAWRYEDKNTGEECITAQPPDRVTDLSRWNVAALYTSPPAQAVPVAEIKWLIERGSPAEYLADIHFGADEWTQDAHSAMKFPNEKIAQEWREKRFPLRVMTDLRICEHVYCEEPPTQPAAVPEGFVLVPKKLTDKMMVILGNMIYDDHGCNAIWNAVLSAAPSAEKP